MIGTLLGNYRVTGQIGEGGMGVVYTAEHEMLGSKAAVKLLLPELSTNQQIVERFFNEAKAAALINHPGLITVFDFGYHDSGSAFIVMEYLEGESLSARIARDKPIAPELIVEFARQACLALGAAHDHDIVHRDLKPDNLFLCPDAALPMGFRVKVLDFGIAKLAGDQGNSVKTRTGSVMGTPTYMAPEQCRGAGQVDLRADIYALACILYEMLCGRPPFVGQGVGEILGKHQYEEAPPPTHFHPSAHAGLSSVIHAALAKDPAERPQSMKELASVLGAAAGMRLPSVPPSSQEGGEDPALAPTVPPVTTLGGAVQARSRADADAQQDGRGMGKVVVLVGGVAVAAAAAFVLTKGGGSNDTPRDSATPAPAAVLADAATTASADDEPVVVTKEQAPDAAPAPTPLTHTIDSKPGGAEVYRALDQVRVGKTPYTFERMPSDGEMVFILKLDGYKTKTVELGLEEARDETFVLESKRRKKPVRPTRPEGRALDPFSTPQ